MQDQWWTIASLCVMAMTFVHCGASSGDDDDDAGDDDVDDDDDDANDDDGGDDDDTFPDDDADDDFEPGEEYEAMVPMGDGVDLWTKVYLPDPIPEGGVPTLMTRTPYRDFNLAAEYEKRARLFAEDGYAFVLQDCRGRNGSEGVFTPYVDENADALDTSEWIASRGWSDGTIGTLGASYDALTALAAAANNPRVVVVVAEEAPDAPSGARKDGGLISKGRLEWLHALAFGGWIEDPEITALTNLLDVKTADTLILGAIDDYWRERVDHPDPEDPLWTAVGLDAWIDDICAPVLSLFAMELFWNDPVDTWRRLRDHGCAEWSAEQRLMVVPEGHGYHTYTLPYLSTTPNALMQQYIDKFLGGRDEDLTTVPNVQYKAEGDPWYWSAEDWPPATDPLTLNLDRDGADPFLRDGAIVDTTPEALTVDPAAADPCAPGAARIAFASEPYPDGLYIAGSVELDVYVSADTPDADVIFDLVEYPASGEKRIIAEAGRRLRYRDGGDALLTPAEVVRVRFDLPPVAFKLNNGARLALEVFPAHCGFFENPHTGEEPSAQTHWTESTLTVYHDGGRPSSITVPARP